MWSVVQQAVECVLSLFLIGLVGYILDRRGWFSQETKAMLPRLVTVITLPPCLFVNIVKTFDRDQLIHLVYGTAVPVVSIVLVFALGLLLARATHVRPGRVGLFSVGFATSNTIFIGLPVNVGLFGMEAVPYVLLYFFANTTFFWTVGNYTLSLDAADRAPEKILSAATVKRVFSPPLLGFLAGVTVVLIGFRPPAFLLNAASHLGSITMPLAILFTGIILGSVSLKRMKPDRDVILVMAGRFVISPLSIILLMQLMPLPPMMAKVFIIQSSLPVVSSASLLAGYYRSDLEFASILVSSSVILALVTIPLYMVIISALPLGA